MKLNTAAKEAELRRDFQTIFSAQLRLRGPAWLKNEFVPIREICV